MKPPKLLALNSNVHPAEYRLEEMVCTIGRHARCNIIVNQSVISRLHARIEYKAPYYILTDVNSANGTFVNGQRIYEPYQLLDQDEIGLASPTSQLRFTDPDSTESISSRLQFDEQNMIFMLNKQPLKLTSSQFRLLQHLYEQAGNLCTRESCAQAIWGRDYDPELDASAFDRAISKLRCRLRRIDPQAEVLRTRRGLGYVLYP